MERKGMSGLGWLVILGIIAYVYLNQSTLFGSSNTQPQLSNGGTPIYNASAAAIDQYRIGFWNLRAVSVWLSLPGPTLDRPPQYGLRYHHCE